MKALCKLLETLPKFTNAIFEAVLRTIISLFIISILDRKDSDCVEMVLAQIALDRKCDKCVLIGALEFMFNPSGGELNFGNS